LEHVDARRDTHDAQAWLSQAAGILGLRLDADGPEARVRAGWEQHLSRFPSSL
jgi:hypothetical protein